MWYITIVLRDKKKILKRKKDTTMKKMFAMLKEYYSIYREGRS